MSQQEILKIQPTREQWNRFIIWHCHVYNAGSQFRDEEFARQLSVYEKELSETDSITLTNSYQIETWQGLAQDNFTIDNDYP